MEGPEITSAEAVIDNGSFGTRTIRFETGRLARQAGGSVSAYLDDETMVLSTTTAGKSPREGFDFFPLTVDVEERMYAAGRIPGSFFRRHQCRLGVHPDLRSAVQRPDRWRPGLAHRRPVGRLPELLRRRALDLRHGRRRPHRR